MRRSMYSGSCSCSTTPSMSMNVRKPSLCPEAATSNPPYSTTVDHLKSNNTFSKDAEEVQYSVHDSLSPANPQYLLSPVPNVRYSRPVSPSIIDFITPSTPATDLITTPTTNIANRYTAKQWSLPKLLLYLSLPTASSSHELTETPSASEIQTETTATKYKKMKTCMCFEGVMKKSVVVHVGRSNCVESETSIDNPVQLW